MSKNNLPNLKQSENAKRTNLAEWRASRMHELELPSGLTVTVRDVTMTDLIFTGKLPASFIDLADEANKNGNAAFDMKKLTENADDFKVMLDALAELALVKPLIGNVPDETHITMDEIPSDDKMAIFNFVNREVTALQSFREGQDKPVAAV